MHQRRGSWYSNFWVNSVRYQKSWEAISKTEAKEKEPKEKENVRLQYCNSGSRSPEAAYRLSCPVMSSLGCLGTWSHPTYFLTLRQVEIPRSPLMSVIKLFNMMKRRVIQSLFGNGIALSRTVFFSLRLQGFL